MANEIARQHAPGAGIAVSRPMSAQEVGAIMTLLVGKWLQYKPDEEFPPALEEAYLSAIQYLDAHILARVLKRLLNSPVKRAGRSWIPDTGDILDAYARDIYPRPTVREAWHEVDFFMGRKGGPYRLSCRLVKAVVEEMGGLDNLWHRHKFEQTPEGILYREFEKVFQAHEDALQCRLAEELMTPPAERDHAALISDYTPFVEPKPIPAPAPPTEGVPPPPDVAEALARVGIYVGERRADAPEVERGGEMERAVSVRGALPPLKSKPSEAEEARKAELRRQLAEQIAREDR